MSLSRNMKTGDRLPDFNPVVTWPDTGLPVDLTTASAIVVNATQNGASLFTGRAATGNAAGQVTMTWNAGDTAATGEILLEVVATIGGKEWSFPGRGYFSVVVWASL